jgi:sensor c-di-GMP phosphodiesterase-like protein
MTISLWCTTNIAIIAEGVEIDEQRQSVQNGWSPISRIFYFSKPCSSMNLIILCWPNRVGLISLFY